MNDVIISDKFTERIVQERRVATTNIIAFPGSIVQLYWPYDGSFQGNDGDIIFRLDGKEYVTNTDWLQKIVASGEYFEEDRQRVFDLIAKINNERFATKGWMNHGTNYWGHTDSTTQIRIIFPNFPSPNKISFVLERRD